MHGLSRRHFLFLAVVTMPALGCQPADAPFREIWEAHYLQGTKVGYGRIAYYRETREGRPEVRIVSEAVLTVLRFGQKFEQRSRDVTWVTEAGDVVRFETRVNLGDVPTTMIGTVTGDKADLVLETPGKLTNEKIDWQPGTGGSTAVPDSLRRKPLVPGETRTLSSFLPFFNRVATTTMTAGAKETTDVDGASRELLRIETKSAIDGKTVLELTLWTDEQGEVWKFHMPLIRQTSFRTTAERAKAAGTTAPVDLGKSTLVRVEPPLADAHRTREVRYRIRMTEGDPTTVFPASEGQTLRKLDDGSVEMIVAAVRPDTPLSAGFTPTPPTDRDRRPNSVVQSDDAEVVRLAATAAGEETDPWTTATRLESFVRAKMNAAALGAFSFSKAFATAAETARTLKGDCTEHAVLLCAMLRARNIPARTVMGLVYVPSAQAFGYHLWTEAFVGDRWIPLDATVGAGGTSAAYLKLADAHLDGVDSFTAFLPLLQVVGRLKVEVLDRQ